MDEECKQNITSLMEECHSIAREKGFWDTERNVGEALMLIVSEVAEAMEAYRTGNNEEFTEELADVCIRIFDLAGGLKLDLPGKLAQKIEYNRTRPYKHGKRF